jgi:8-oxo-dGTP pyrophosphatase MutT (NUDIX family)
VGAPVTATHAGGVVYRFKRGAPQFLLVTAKVNSNIWVLPKGHIDPGEDHAACALREVHEESGVRAAIVEYLGLVEFQSVRCKFYLMLYLSQEPADEGRKIEWLDLKQAIQRIPEESKQMLRELQGQALPTGPTF